MHWLIVLAVIAAAGLVWWSRRPRVRPEPETKARQTEAPPAQKKVAPPTVVKPAEPATPKLSSAPAPSAPPVVSADSANPSRPDILAVESTGYLPTAIYTVSEEDFPLPPVRDPAPPESEPLRILSSDTGTSRRRRRKQASAPDKNSRLLFLDVETTGLSSDDRIVSIGMVNVLAGDLLNSEVADSYGLAAETIHLVFNPERPSNPFAQRVHGWPDSVLARQSPFAAHAPSIADMLKKSDIWIAHNLEFDLRFIRQEFRRLPLPVPRRDTFCTMEHARELWAGQTAKLDHCVGRIGLARAGDRHGALEDALLCAALYTHYQIGKTFRGIPECGQPTNLLL